MENPIKKIEQDTIDSYYKAAFKLLESSGKFSGTLSSCRNMLMCINEPKDYLVSNYVPDTEIMHLGSKYPEERCKTALDFFNAKFGTDLIYFKHYNIGSQKIKDTIQMCFGSKEKDDAKYERKYAKTCRK